MLLQVPVVLIMLHLLMRKLLVTSTLYTSSGVRK